VKLPKEDKVISILCFNPHEQDWLFQRPDSTTYVVQHRKGKEDFIYTPETQLELPLDLPKPLKSHVPQGFPHQNMLQKKYGEDWVPVSNPDLEPH